MSDASETRFCRRNNPILWGIAATLSILLVGAMLSWMDTCSISEFGVETCQTKWAAFLNASPNEVGDTLAGFAGALAFVWIIATVWLQSHELRAQREELKLNRDEMIEQRKATQEMARAMSAQAAIFEDEQRQRDEIRAKEYFEEILKGIVATLREEENLEGNWVTGSSSDDIVMFIGHPFRVFDNLEDKLIDEVLVSANVPCLVRSKPLKVQNLVNLTMNYRKTTCFTKRYSTGLRRRLVWFSGLVKIKRRGGETCTLNHPH